jgi:hypothetical protein
LVCGCCVGGCVCSRSSSGGRRDGNVKVAFYELEVWSEVAEECVHGGRGEVAETQDLADFAGCEEFFELLRVALESREVREAGRG